MNSDISVVIPAFNEESNIDDAILSAKLNSVKPHEVIVVDDNSSDNTVDVARRHADKVIELNKRIPVGGVRNTGVKHASGDIIMGTDADCILQHGVLKEVNDRFTSDPALMAVSFDITAKPDEAPVERYATKVGSMPGLGAATAYRKLAWEEIGGYKNNGAPKYDEFDPDKAGDVDFWRRIHGKKKFIEDPKVMAEVNELKGGMIPVLSVSSIVSFIGFLMDRYGSDLGEPTMYLGVGSILGELGHQFLERFLKDTGLDYIFLHHDLLGLAGVSIAELYDHFEGIPEGKSNMAKMVPLGVFIQHLATEGFTPLHHYDRRTIMDDEETGRYTSKGDTE